MSIINGSIASISTGKGGIKKISGTLFIGNYLQKPKKSFVEGNKEINYEKDRFAIVLHYRNLQFSFFRIW
jgi:hypothetical protein